MSNDKKISVQYPFTTKAQITARIASEDDFACECLEILQARTVGRTGSEKSYGLMSSHVKKGAALSENPSADMPAVRALVSSYTKQLAAHFRAAEIAANPDLAEVAKVFSAG